MTLIQFQCKHQFATGFRLDIEFESSHGVTALFGQSGSGKTSVLNIIAGVIRAQEALVRLGDRVLCDAQSGIYLQPERRHVGFVFQDHLLFPHLSVTKNLNYGYRRRQSDRKGKTPNQKRAVDFDRVVNVLELKDLLHRFPRNLSGGEKQRVAIGRALLSEPDLLLMDEPLAAVDDALKDRVLSYFEKVIDEWSIPTLYVSHNQSEVHRLAEWVVVLNSGKVQSHGKPEKALASNMAQKPDPNQPSKA